MTTAQSPFPASRKGDKGECAAPDALWSSHLVDHLIDLLLGLRQRRWRVHLAKTDGSKRIVNGLPEAVAILDRPDPLPVRQDVERGLHQRRRFQDLWVVLQRLQRWDGVRRYVP